MLAITLCEFERAEWWLARAHALSERLGARLYTHCVAVVQARLIFRARPRELSRARALLEGACAFANEKGIRWLFGYADLVSRETPHDGPAAGTDRMPLHGLR
jgi:hypothetical protein